MGLTRCEANHPGLVTRLLLHLILESQALGGSFLNEFWLNLGKCDPRLQENSTLLLFPIHACFPSHKLIFIHPVSKLDAAPELISENDVTGALFHGVPAVKFNLTPIISLAGEYLHISG